MLAAIQVLKKTLCRLPSGDMVVAHTSARGGVSVVTHTLHWNRIPDLIFDGGGLLGKVFDGWSAAGDLVDFRTLSAFSFLFFGCGVMGSNSSSSPDKPCCNTMCALAAMIVSLAMSMASCAISAGSLLVVMSCPPRKKDLKMVG